MEDDETKEILLKPLSYHVQTQQLLEHQQPELWNWFESDEANQLQFQAARLDLLKSTYRIDAESDPEIYEIAKETAKTLELDVPIAIYQAQASSPAKASISAIGREAHIVFQGDLRDRLDNTELSSVLAHELSHLLLWQNWSGKYLTTYRILLAMAEDPAASSGHLESLRRYVLFVEIFCDRGAAIVLGDIEPVITSLVKIETGIKKVNAKSYLKQSQEIFAAEDPLAEGVTHPEMHIRVRALDQWHCKTRNHESHIDEMIRGRLSLEEIDLLGQRDAAKLTRQVIDLILAPAWMISDATTSHASLFFADYKPATLDEDWVIESIRKSAPDFQRYVQFLMLDFITCDRDAMEPALGHCISLAGKFGFKEDFLELARKELRLRKKQIESIEMELDQLARKLSTQRGDA